MEISRSRVFFFNRVNATSLNLATPSYYTTDFDHSINYSTFSFYNFFFSSELVSYFKSLSIDTPFILNKVSSYRRTRFKTKFIRLNNYFFRDGKRLKFLKTLLFAYDTISYSLISSLNTSLQTKFLWKEVFLSLSYLTIPSTSTISLSNSNFLRDNDFYSNEPITRRSLFYSNFKLLDIAFSFFVYKVDKHIFKNSRGKSGKYTFIWKYIPVYKRFAFTAHWLMREIRVAPGTTLLDRLNHVLNIFLTDITRSWLWRIKKFSAYFVYFNLKTTLGTSYRLSRKTF